MPDPTSPISAEEHEKLRRWRSEFQLDYKVFSDWQNSKREWERFYDGDQLTAEEKIALKARNQPEVVINKIKPRIDGVIGDFLGRRVMMRARDKGSADFEVAKHVTEALRYVEDQNRFDESEAKVAEDLFVGGVGWYKVSLEFDFLEPEIRISYRSNDDVIVDRRCRKRDLSDAKRLWETVWVEVEDLVELYPQHAQFIREAAQTENQVLLGSSPMSVQSSGDDYAKSENVSPDVEFDFDTFLDPKRQRLRLINVSERVQKRIEFAFHPDLKGAVVEITDFTSEELAMFERNFPNNQKFARTKYELNSGIFIANKILEEHLNIRPHDSKGKFMFSRAMSHVEHEDQKPYGLVKQYVHAQMEYNKRRSKLLHKTNVSRVIAEEGAIPQNDIEKTRREVARPDGFILIKAGKRFDVDRDEPGQSDVYLLQLSQNEIEDAGPSREFIGTENKPLSGKAIGLRQIDGQKMLRPFFAALRSARREIFTIALEEMQQYWTGEKLIKITDDPEAGSIMLNQRTTVNGQVVIQNNLRLGKYDIKVDEDLETPNQRAEQFSQLAQLAPVILQSGEVFPVEMLIKSSDLPNKKEWLDAIQLRRQQQMAMQKMQLQAMQLQAMMKAGNAPNG